MRSKTFYSKFVKASFVKQLWIMGIVALAYLITLVVPLAVMMNNWGTAYILSVRIEEYQAFMLQGVWVYMTLVASAVFVAFRQFLYLHSGKQMDFYGSLPVKKETLFTQRAIFGYIDFLVPFTVLLALTVIVGATRDLVTGIFLVRILELWLINQIGFWLIYLTTALAIIFTGRGGVGFLGTLVLLGGGYVLYWLTYFMNETFFETCYQVETRAGVMHLSPIYLFWAMQELLIDINEKQMISKEVVVFLLCMVAVCAVLFLANRYLVRIRPAEKAGQSMSFNIPSRLIHIFLSVVGGLAIGMIMMSFVYVNVRLWFLLGAVLGALAIYVLVQFIYTRDIKRTFRYKWQFIGVELVVVLIGFVYCFDLLGYDSYLPDQDKLESVAIRCYDDNIYGDYYLDGERLDGIWYAFETMKLPADDMTYDLLEEVTANQDLYRYGDEEVADSKVPQDLFYDLSNLYVRYRLESGREVERMYLIPIKQYKETMIHFYDQENYRSVVIPSEKHEAEQYDSLSYYSAGQESMLFQNEAKEQIAEFMEIYNSEIKKIDSAILVEDNPVTKLFVTVESSHYIARRELPVYAECTETLARLKEWNADPIADLNPEYVLQIEVEDYTTEPQEYKTYTFTEKEDIAIILDAMVDEYLGTPFQTLDDSYYIRVLWNKGEGDYHSWGHFLAGNVPDIVLEQ